MNTRYTEEGTAVAHAVTCSCCGREAAEGSTYRAARLAAESDDWHSDGGSGYECPDCRDE